jgi:hypothetical protein
LNLKRRFFAIIAIFLITGSACTTSPPLQVSFEGKVIRGQSFEKELRQKLSFRLVPFEGDGQGWKIWVGDKTRPEQNFSAYVTPPYRGPNGRYIVGWTFTRPELGSQVIRRFDFVLNESDHQLASDELRKLMWPYEFSEAEVEQAREIRDAIPTAGGTLTITNIEIENSTSSSFPLINLLEFEVNINLSTNREQ